MNLLRRFRLHAYILVLLSIAGLTFAEDAPLRFILSCLAVVTSWWLLETPKPRAFPRWIINLGVLLASVLLFQELVLEHDHEPNLLLALGHFMTLILLCKLFERKSNRDYAQVLALSLLIIVTAAIFSSNLLFGLILAAYLGLGLYTVLLFHLRTETDHALAHQAATGTPFVLPDPSIRRDVRFVTLGCGIALTLFAALVFLAFPRDKGRAIFGNWALRNATMLTGFSEQVSFGDFGRLQQSPAVVMNVRLEIAGAPVGSEVYQPYFRGTTLDSYVHQQWVRSLRRLHTNGDEPQRINLDPELGPPQPLIAPGLYHHAGIVTQHYTLFTSTNNTLLFTMAPPAVIRCPQLHSVEFSPRDFRLATGAPAIDGLQYDIDTPVVVDPKAYPAPGVPVIDSFDPATFFPLDAPIPQGIVDLARQAGADLFPTDGRPLSPNATINLATRYETYLRTHYAYSLSLHAVDPSIDPTEDFLLHRQKIGGHCEFFASAFVLMCRSAGIPTRMVTGYHGGEYNVVGEFYVVRQLHAHAWAEIYVPTRGWVSFDPTPAADEPLPTSTSVALRWFRDVYEVIQRRWLNGIVSFDNNTRKYLMELISTPFRNLPNFRQLIAAACADFHARYLSSDSSWTARIVLLLGFSACLSFAAWLVRRFHRHHTSEIRTLLRQTPRLDRATQKRLAHDLEFFDDFMRTLRRTGPRRPPHQTLREYVALVCQSVRQHASAQPPAWQTDASWLVDIFYDLRFGTLQMTPDLREQIAQRVTLLKKAIATS